MSKGRVAVFAEGSRGDCQPYVGLIVGLRKEGYQVRLYSSKSHRSTLADPFGIDMFEFTMDVQEILATNKGCLEAMQGGDAAKFVEAMENAVPVDVTLNDWHNVILDVIDFKADICLSGVVSTLCMACMTEACGIPHIIVNLQPHCPSKEYPSVIGDMLFKGKTPKFLNMTTHKLFLSILASSLSKPDHPMNLVRKQCFKLPGTYTKDQVKYLFNHPAARTLICMSSTLFQRPPSWDPMLDVVGALFVPEEEQVRTMAPPSDALKAFIEAGDTPVYVGWGSMICKGSEFMTEIAVRSCYISKQRGILCPGWGKLSPDHLNTKASDYAEVKKYMDGNIIFADNLPHLWLFPRCKCIICHGGSGTTHAAVASGTPVIITPCLLDQFSFARMVNTSGVGVGTGKLKELTPQKLGQIIKKVVEDPEIAKRAQKAAEIIKSEDGAGRVIMEVNKLMEKAKTGEWKDEFSEGWTDILKNGPPSQGGCCGGGTQKEPPKNRA